MKKNLCSIVFVLIAFIIIGPVSAKEWQNDYHGFSSKEEMVKNLRENFVPQDKIDLLIKKSENNEPWDIDKKECLNNIPEEFYSFNPQDGSQTRYYRFDDGSFIKISNQLLDDMELNISNKTEQFLTRKVGYYEATRIIDNMKSNQYELQGVEHGTGYAHFYDFKVSHRVGAMYADMIVEFYTIQNGNDEIIPSGCFSPNAYGFGSLEQMPTIEVVRRKEDSSRRQWALVNSHWFTKYRLDTEWGGSDLSGTHYLWLAVGNDTYRVAPSLPY